MNDQYIPDTDDAPGPSESDPYSFFKDYPEVMLEMISIYYPLPADWLKKYADILLWGGEDNVDISIYASQMIYYPGLIFNKAITWDEETRTLLFANLSVRGGGLQLPWYMLGADDQVLRDWFDRIVAFVKNCPLDIDHAIQCHAMGLHTHYCIELEDTLGVSPDDPDFIAAKPKFWANCSYEACYKSACEKFEPEVTKAIRWSDLVWMLIEKDVPSPWTNPALWELTFKKYMTAEVVERLLAYFYSRHIGMPVK